MTTDEIVRALRCASTPGGPTGNCEKCPYWKKEQLSGKLKERLGTDEWTSCDVDKIGLDAADLIERLTAENEALREGASLGKLKRSQKQAYEKSIKFLRALADGQASEIKKLQADLDWKTLFAESALDAQERAEKAEAERDALREKVPRWISVHGESPKPGTRVLATDGVFVGEAYRTSADTWRRYDGIAMRDCIGSVVTHWIPLPEAPEVNDGKENS